MTEIPGKTKHGLDKYASVEMPPKRNPTTTFDSAQIAERPSEAASENSEFA